MDIEKIPATEILMPRKGITFQPGATPRERTTKEKEP